MVHIVTSGLQNVNEQYDGDAVFFEVRIFYLHKLTHQMINLMIKTTNFFMLIMSIYVKNKNTIKITSI